MAFQFHLQRRVEFGETDMAGIMHFTNFFRFMEAAESAFMRSVGLSIVPGKCGLEVCLPRVHAECDYIFPLRFEDEVSIELLVERKGTRSLTYQFRFYLQGKGERKEAARGRLTCVCAQKAEDGTLGAVALPAAFDVITPAPPELLNAPPPPALRGESFQPRGLTEAKS